ncbi:MAG: DUF362 domain-containing protein, partial [Deltaproteobacteria bacterium]|nr:DUF362 domain-containing protein [Deltaproteobacteria bacterium]
PRCSSHVLAGNTLGMKAAVGYWRTDTRLEYHRDAATLQEKTAEGNTVETLRRKQRLVLSMADKILTTFGPDYGYVYQPDKGVVIASDSVVAHDMVSLAWLLANRRRIPPTEKDKFINNSPVVAGVCNYWITYKLGGWRPVLASEILTRPDTNTIWDDRTLNRAYQIFGGLPQVTIDAANDTLPEELRKQLSDMTTYPAQRQEC